MNRSIQALCYTALALLTPAALSQSANSGRILDSEGRKMGMFFGVVNAFQFYVQSWK